MPGEVRGVPHPSSHIPLQPRECRFAPSALFRASGESDLNRSSWTISYLEHHIPAGIEIEVQSRGMQAIPGIEVAMLVIVAAGVFAYGGLNSHG